MTFMENLLSKARDVFYRVQRKLDGDEGSLYLNGILRMLALIALVMYFEYWRDNFNQLELFRIEILLFTFFVYNVVMGFVGVLHPKWFMRTWIKVPQFFFEIVMYSLFYLWSKDARTDLYFLYFIPLFFSVHFLTFFRALGVILFGGLNLYVVMQLIPLPVERTSWFLLEPSLNSVFWPRFILLLAISTSYAIRRRGSLALELQDEKTTIMGLFRSIEDGVFLIDAKQRLVYVNEALQERHGPFTPGQESGAYFRSKEEILDLESAEDHPNTEMQLPIISKVNFVDLDGNKYQAEITLILLQNDRAGSRGALGIVKDVGRIEKNLKKQLITYGERVKSLLFQRKLWQETFVDMSKHLSGFEDPDELMNFVVEETCQRLNAETCSLFILKENILQRQAIAGINSNWLTDECYLLGEGITGQVIKADQESKYGKVIRQNHVSQDSQVVAKYLENYKAQLKTHQVGHLIAVPLNSQQRSFGVLRVVNKLDKQGNLARDGFTLDDQEFLVTIAAMVAIALENCRLYNQEQERRMLSDTLLEVSGKITANLNLRNILPEILNELGKVLPFSSISIQVKEGRQLKIIACRGFKNQRKVMRLRFPVGDRRFPNSQVIATKAPLRLDDVRKSYPVFLEESGKYNSENIRSWIGVPLINQGRVIGMLTLDHHSPGFYTTEMESIAMTFANQVAIAITNANLFREQKKQTKNLDKLLKVSKAVATSIKLDDVLSEIVKMANQISRSDHSGVVLLDNNGVLNQSYETKSIGQHLHLRTRSEGVTNQVLNQRKPFFFNNVNPNDAKHNPVIAQTGFRSYGGLPIIGSGKVLGVLFVHSYKKNCYDRYKIIPLLETLCNQAAIAINNALLYEEINNQANLLQELVDASADLIRHTSLKKLIQHCAQSAVTLFDVEDCSIYLKNNERYTIDLVYSTTIPEEVWTQWDSHLDRPGLTAHVVRTGDVLNFGGDAYKRHPQWAGRNTKPFLEHLQHLPSKVCHSLLLGPLKDSQGEIIGVLKLENRRGAGKNHRFENFSVNLHQTFSSHIGTAVERARLYEQLDSDARKAVRHELSYDLHEISNLVHGALIMRLEVAREKLAREYFMDVGGELVNISKAAQTVNSRLRWIHYELRGDDVLHERGLIPALRQFAELLNIPFEGEVMGREILPFEIEYPLYKIGMEAMLNTAKYGGEHVRATVRLYKEKTGFTAEFRDNGRGFNKEMVSKRSHKFGLESIQRWSESIGAQLDIQSLPGAGTTILVVGSIQKTEGV